MSKKVIAVIGIYATIGFAVFGHSDAQRFALCDARFDAGYMRGRCYETNFYKSALAGLFWPVAIPFSIGTAIADGGSEPARTTTCGVPSPFPERS